MAGKYKVTTRGNHRVVLGRLCVQREDHGACRFEVHTPNHRVHRVLIPGEWLETVITWDDANVDARGFLERDAAGQETIRIYGLRRMAPGEVVPRTVGTSLAEMAEEQGRDVMTLADLLPVLEAMMPTSEDAEAFGRHLEELRGRKIFD